MTQMARRPHVGSVEGARVHSAADLGGREAGQAYVELYWLPLGAGSSSVRSSGRAFERLAAHRAERPRQPLYHSALKVRVDADVTVIEMTPALRRPVDRGVVAIGPVGTRWPPRSRAYCYEVRRWPAGEIGDVTAAVDSPRRVSSDDLVAGRLLSLVAQVPTFTWGRDEQRAGAMWNSNSVVAWLLARTGHDMHAIAPPPPGRAPGWSAGLVLAERQATKAGPAAQAGAPATPATTMRR